MFKIETSIVINRPVEEVFPVVSNLENNPKWDPDFVEVEKISQGPIGVGTTWRYVQKAVGQRIEAEAEVAEYELNRKCTHKGKSPFPAELQMTFASVGDGTQLNLRFEAEPGGFFRLAGPILKIMLKRAIVSDFANLKNLMEAHAL
jgi:uncharacterized membrane protein